MLLEKDLPEILTENIDEIDYHDDWNDDGNKSGPFKTVCNIKNAMGRTALDEAQMVGKDDVAGLLLKFSTINPLI